MSKEYLMEQYRLARESYKIAPNDKKKREALDEMAKVVMLGAKLYPGFYDDVEKMR